MNEVKLFELDDRAQESVRSYTKQRFVMERLLRLSGRPFVLIQGPRGVGKTVMLRQMRSPSADAIYLSADTLGRQDQLSDIVKSLYARFNISTFFIDEIHFFPDFHRELKELYDFLPVRIFCTSSSALSLETASYDLSRRVERISVHPCSFREYLYFLYGNMLPPLSLEDILKAHIDRPYLRYAKDFARYLHGGGYLFTLDSKGTLQQFEQIRQTILKTDIPRYQPHLSMKDLINIEQVLRFMGRSPIEGINYSSIAQNVGITKYKAQQYLQLLEKAFLVQTVLPIGTNVLKEPKVFMEIPYRLLYRDYDDCIGSLREDFFSLCMRLSGIPFSYVKSSKGKKIPDFSLEWDNRHIILEIGGKGKGRKQFKGTSYDQKLILYHSETDVSVSGDRLPLFLLGFLSSTERTSIPDITR